MVADADLMTLLCGLELGVATCLSASPESRRWRALRAARSLVALEVDGESPLSAAALPRSHTSPELPAADREEEELMRHSRSDPCGSAGSVLTCERGLAQLAAGGARGGGRLV